MILSAISLRRAFRRELLVLYLVVCMADVFVGLALPLFPLLAQGLGASLTFIGVLTAINAGMQVVAGVPLGILSDRYSRGLVITLGLALFVITAALLIWAPSPIWLIPAQITLGTGIVATFVMGGALASSLSLPDERGAVMGLYTTAMGLGFTIGPLLGGLLAVGSSAARSLFVAGSVALCGLLLALWGLPLRPAPRAQKRAVDVLNVPMWTRALLFACLANLLFSPIFGAVVVTFVPLQTNTLGFGSLAIGSLFSIRALASTATRLPTGVISTPPWSRRLILIALALSGLALLALAGLHSYPAFVAALALEGVSYGIFLTAGQAFVAQHTDRQRVGAALGTYNMAGGISVALSPFLLGMLAERAGIAALFWYVGVLVLLGAAVLALLLRYARR